MIVFVLDEKVMDAIICLTAKFYPHIEITGMFRDCDLGKKMLEKHKPDIVLFQCRSMEHLSGDLFFMLEMHQYVYSMMATENNLLQFRGNYLTPNILFTPIIEANFKIVMDANVDRHFILKPSGAAVYYYHSKLVCPQAMQTFNEFTYEHGFIDIMLGNISFLKSNKQRTFIHLIEEKEMVSTNQSMSRLIKHLPPEMFVAIGRSTRINGLELLDYNLDDKGTIHLKNNPHPLKVKGKFNNLLFAWIEKNRKDMLED
jgi:hypothetical protein